MLIDIVAGFIDTDQWHADDEVCEQFMLSAVVPILEAAFRCASFLEISKQHELYHSYLDLTMAVCKQEKLLPILVEMKKCYIPNQVTPIYTLLDKVNELGKIFLNCLSSTDDDSSKVSADLARKVAKTNECVQDAIEDLLADTVNKNFIEDALQLGTEGAYKALLSPIRFDNMSMKNDSGAYNHYHKDLISQSTTIKPKKMVRLAQELADLSNSLPDQNTNAIFVRVDQDRTDVMKAIITGSNQTPYAHGCYEFDIFFVEDYPN